jgi:23S rRNA (adenine2503-C2)-methyltransferase
MLPEEVRPHLPRGLDEAYRADQLLSWVHDRGESDFGAMTNLPRRLRDEARERFTLGTLVGEATTTSADGDATKFLWRLADGLAIESVHLVLPTNDTFCISSQVGCAYGCTFCATATMGFRRNLTDLEIFEEVWRMRLRLRELRGEPTAGYNVVFMGMGEPLANYDHVVGAIRRLIHPKGLNLGERRITVSTCGLANQIRRLGEEGLKVGLAVSLNATTDEVRSRTMPVTRKHGIEEVLAAAEEFAHRTGRRVTFEYVLLRGTTDTPDDIVRLARIAARIPCKINVIPFNPFPGSEHERPDDGWIQDFIDALMARAPAAVTRRVTRGLDIAAACGQLAVHA